MTGVSPADTAGTARVGTKTSPPRFPCHIIARHGVLQATITKACPYNEQCALCTTWLDGKECHYRRGRRTSDCFTKARIPARFHNATIEALNTHNSTSDCSPSIAKATKWLLKWCHTQPLPQKGLLLTGTQGTGKSFAMAAIIRHLTLSYATDALFLDFQDFIRELKHCYHRKDNDYELFDKLRQKEVLILDDVQPIRDSPWIREVLHTIIAQRYNECSQTFLTTNLSMTNDFKEWATPHTYSRLKQMCYWLQFHGPDRRGIEQ